VPVIIEHILSQPKVQLPTVMGQLEAFSHSGSIFIVDEKVALKALKQKVDTWLGNYKEIEFGSSEATVNGLVVKILANGAEHLFQIISLLLIEIKTEFLEE